MASFMKKDDPLHLIGSDLLRIKPSIPIEIQKPGQLFRPYDSWVQAVCLEEHLPKRKTAGAAGHDLYSIEENDIPAGGSVVVSTGVCIQLPVGHYGKIEGRSSLGIQHSIVPFGGIIDEDYRGIIMVKLFNHGPTNYHISSNDRIAQLIIQRYTAPKIQCVATLNSTERNTGGFGSTGR